jgi:sugar-phosphatase
MSNFAGIIFDMDGTLVDSEGTWETAQVAMFAEMGVAYSDEVRQQIIGLRLDDGLQRVIDAYNLETTAQALSENLVKRMLTLIPQQVEAKPGAQELVAHVAQMNTPHCVASSSPLAIIEATIQAQNWQDFLPHYYSAESVPNGKPAPDVYLYAAEKINAAPEQCLAIEDSPNGARAAVAAGMTCYVVPDFHSPKAAFAEITPHVFDDLHEVLATLKRS